MGQRILVLISTLAALFATPLVYALGLGEINLQSALNQPLKAEIKLLQVRDLERSEILVGLGTPEDFERIGIDRPYFLTDLRFEVDLDAPGGAVIRVNSRKPVREPYLNFIIQAQWPSGKLLREYTLLLDLPVFSESQAQGVQTTSSFSGAPTTQQPSYQAPTPSSQANQPSSTYNPRSSYAPEGSFNQQRPSGTQRSSAPPRLAGADEYSVAAGDTLWEISSAVRPDRGVSIQQTMLAIQRLNPDAFINNNINLLKKGQILRIPDREDILSTTQQAAVREVAVQNSEWSGASYDYGSSGVQLEGSSSYSTRESSSTRREGRLSLASPEDAENAYEGRGSGSGESSQAALENELAITLEQLDKTERENSELRSKIASLEEQIETAEKLVEITSEDLRAAELSAQKTEEQREAAEQEAASIADEGSSETSLNEEISDTSSDSQPADEKQVAAEQKPEERKPPVRQPVQPVYEKTIVDHIMDNIIYIGVGVLALIVLGAFFFLRSRANDGFDDEDFMSEASFDEPQSEFDVEQALAEEESLDLFEEEETPDEPVEEERISEAQTEDVVAEADIYIAYGKYDQAEEILLKSLEQDPDNKDARLKLVEVYASQQNGDKFDHHFAILHQLGDNEVISRAEQLRSGIEGLDVFDPSAAPAIENETTMVREVAEEASSDDGALDFSLDVEDTASDELSLDLDSGSDSDDFSLDLDSDGGGLEDEPGLDLDLDSDNDDFSLDVDSEGSADDLDFDLGDLDVDLDADTTANESSTDSDDEFSLDLDSDSGDVGDLEFDLGGDLDGELDTSDDDLAIDLDSGEEGGDDFGDLDLDLDGELELGGLEESAVEDDNTLIEDNLEEDIEPIDFDLSAQDTEVGSTPDVSDDDLGDLEFELDADADLDGELELDLDEGTAEESEDDFDLELSDESIEEFDDVPDLSLDDVSDDALDPIVDQGSEDLTLISPAVTEEDIAAKDDDLDLEGDLDLSALDKELDALTGDSGDLEDLEAGISSVDSPSAPPEPMGLELELEPEPEPAPQPEPEPLQMDEPVIDFDGLEEPDDQGSDEETVLRETDMGDDTMFNQAMSEVPESDVDFDLPEIDPEAIDDDTDLGFLSDSDETATKLDLARAYIDMGDAEGARDIIGEIMKEGNDQQRAEAEALMKKLS